MKASPAYYFVLFHPLRRQRHFPGVVVGVQQLVCHAGERFLQILIVDFLYFRILVGETQIALGIQKIEILGADCSHLAAFVNRLSAAAYAAARTGHDFHKVIEDLAFAYCLDQPAGVSETADYGDFDGGASDVDGCFPPAVHAADAVECVRFRIFSGGHVVAGAERRFHDAAGGAEDHPGSGAFAARGVKVILRQAVDIDVQGTKIIDKFPCI